MSDTNEWENFYPVSRHLTAKANKLNIPLHGVFELTSRCNFNCKMCYVHFQNNKDEDLKSKELTVKQWIDIAKAAKQAGTLFLLLTGGEAMIRDDFIELYQQLAVMGFRIVINTNGSLLHHKVIECFKVYPPARINVSLYGSTDETYRRICGVPAYNDVTKAIKILKKLGISVRITMTITSYNCHDMEEIYRFSKEEDTLLEMSAYIFPPIRNDKNNVGTNNARLPAKEAGKYTVLHEKLQYDNFYELMVSMLKEREKLIKESVVKQTEGEKIKCQAGRSSYWITWEGKMHPCGIMNKPESDVMKVGFNKAWQEICHAVYQIRLPVECSNCCNRKICKICAAMCLCESGSFDKKPEYVCEMIDARVEKYYQELKKLNSNKN